MREMNRTEKAWWTVLSPGEFDAAAYWNSPCHVWVATGPLGCDCGVEASHDAAAAKARCAAHILRDLTREKREGAS